MQLGDGDFESLKSKEQQEPKKELQKEAQEEVQDYAVDEALDKLLDGLEVLDISGGMAIIAMPLQMLKMLSMFGELLKNHEREISR